MDAKNFLSWLLKQPIVTKVLILISAILIAVATILFTSCGVARNSVVGDRVVDKNVKDSIHYEVVLEK